MERPVSALASRMQGARKETSAERSDRGSPTKPIWGTEVHLPRLCPLLAVLLTFAFLSHLRSPTLSCYLAGELPLGWHLSFVYGTSFAKLQFCHFTHFTVSRVRPPLFEFHVHLPAHPPRLGSPSRWGNWKICDGRYVTLVPAPLRHLKDCYTQPM